MIRKIIQIDENKCNGCGLCVSACHEGAIGLVNGKAKLLRDDYCDGLGNCLPVCPTGAITFEEREALAFNEAAVSQKAQTPHQGCPGSMAKTIKRENDPINETGTIVPESQLKQWPIQIKLVAPNARFFNNADLLIAADCTAFSYGNFHNEFMKDKVTIIGCPKLDDGDYSEKLAAIFKMNTIHSITVLRMEVPCCGGIVYAVTNALEMINKDIPLKVITIGIDGQIK